MAEPTTLSVRTAPWAVAGTYFEACNCDAICPCRRVGPRDGGRSTHGHCDFALSWHIATGHAGDLDLSGLDVVMAGTYDDDPDRPSPRGHWWWEVALYIDERATPAQHQVLADMFLGRAGGTTLTNFAAAIGEVRTVRRARIRLDHRSGRQSIAVPAHVVVRVRHPVATDAAVSCAIPGHDHPGQEWVADVMRVTDGPLVWDVTGRCAFATDFAYRSN
jgi:hypothetical protein